MNLDNFRKREFIRREKRMKHICRQNLVKKGNLNDALHIVYVMTHTGICGGTKIILQHANLLIKAGHKITLISHFEKPKWFPIYNEVEYLQIPFATELATGIPPCELIIATYWREISECVARKIAPVIYFEQGDFHLFDPDQLSKRMKHYIDTQFMLADDIFTVSQGAADQIAKVYHRSAIVIHNGIDQGVFKHTISKESKSFSCTVSPIRLITIGSDKSLFKGIHGIKEALKLLKIKNVPYRFSWITPDEPDECTGDVYVNPTQQKIAELLADADIYLCNSIYESFSLPVLEAMACGCSIITTPNDGVKEYCEDGNNCLMIQMENPIDLADKIIHLYRDYNLRHSLILGGLITAKQFDWTNIVPELLRYYKKVAEYRPIIS